MNVQRSVWSFVQIARKAHARKGREEKACSIMGIVVFPFRKGVCGREFVHLQARSPAGRDAGVVVALAEPKGDGEEGRKEGRKEGMNDSRLALGV